MVVQAGGKRCPRRPSDHRCPGSTRSNQAQIRGANPGSECGPWCLSRAQTIAGWSLCPPDSFILQNRIADPVAGMPSANRFVAPKKVCPIGWILLGPHGRLGRMVSSMWKATSGNLRFGITDLGFFLNSLGTQLELYEDLKNCAESKDKDCPCHYSPYLEGITNGEYFFSAYDVLAGMLGESPPDEPSALKKAILRSLMNSGKSDFLDATPTGNWFAETAKDLWKLWKACRSCLDLPVWEVAGQPAEPPSLSSLERSDWQFIFSFLHEELLDESQFEDEAGNFALNDPQPHWPTHQEYRRARIWILSVCRDSPQ